MKKIIIASGPVIAENGKVLLNKSGDTDFWKFCGGKTEVDETLEQTAIREVKEEMGIKIKILSPEPFIFYTKKFIKEAEIEILLVHFLAERMDEIEPGADIREWRWHDLNNLPVDLGPNVLPALRHFKLIE